MSKYKVGDHVKVIDSPIKELVGAVGVVVDDKTYSECPYPIIVDFPDDRGWPMREDEVERVEQQ